MYNERDNGTKDVGAKVECDECPWDGYEIDLIGIDNGDEKYYSCPACQSETISGLW